MVHICQIQTQYKYKDQTITYIGEPRKKGPEKLIQIQLQIQTQIQLKMVFVKHKQNTNTKTRLAPRRAKEEMQRAGGGK